MPDAASDGTARRDWVQEAYQAFIANASGLDPTDPVKAIGEHFRRNASPELKARCMCEGKTPAKCWKFVEAVARKALNGRSGHVDPSAVYAIAMHWFEDVPVDWDAKPAAPAKKTAADCGQTEANGYRSNEPEDVEAAKRSMEIAEKKRREVFVEVTGKPPPEEGATQEEKAECLERNAATAKPKPKRRPKDRQTFFFDILAGGNGASVG